MGFGILKNILVTTGFNGMTGVMINEFVKTFGMHLYEELKKEQHAMKLSRNQDSKVTQAFA